MVMHQAFVNSLDALLVAMRKDAISSDSNIYTVIERMLNTYRDTYLYCRSNARERTKHLRKYILPTVLSEFGVRTSNASLIDGDNVKDGSWFNNHDSTLLKKYPRNKRSKRPARQRNNRTYNNSFHSNVSSNFPTVQAPERRQFFRGRGTGKNSPKK
jgi:hypothetical protein